LGSPQARQVNSDLVSSPCFFLSTSKGASIDINPAYKDVPYFQEKLKVLKAHISCDKSAIALWEAEMPKYYLLPKVKEQLARNEKLLKEFTGGQPCP